MSNKQSVFRDTFVQGHNKPGMFLSHAVVAQLSAHQTQPLLSPLNTPNQHIIVCCCRMTFTCVSLQSRFLRITFRRRGSDEVTEAASPSCTATTPEYQRAAPTVSERGDASDGAGTPAVNPPGAQMLNVIGGIIAARRRGWGNTQDAEGEL